MRLDRLRTGYEGTKLQELGVLCCTVRAEDSLTKAQNHGTLTGRARQLNARPICRRRALAPHNPEV